MACSHIIMVISLMAQLLDVVLVKDLPDPPGDPSVNCPKFVSEDDGLRCRCEARFLDTRPSDFSLTWPGHSDSPDLQLTKVTRRDNGTVFTCLMVWNGRYRMTNYVLQVAYGPYDEHTSILGPSTFITNGSMPLTLTCRATDVNPSPAYLWDNKCDNFDMVTGTCTFTPPAPWGDGLKVVCRARSREGANKVSTAMFVLNLLYPPMGPPVITSDTPDDVSSHDTGEQMCSVAGGKPPVSKVIFTCENLQYLYTSTKSRNGAMSSSLIIDKGSDINNSVLCTCRGLWEPQEDLYTQTKSILLKQDVSNYKYDATRGWIYGFLTATAISIAIFIICIIAYYYLRKKRSICADNKPQGCLLTGRDSPEPVATTMTTLSSEQTGITSTNRCLMDQPC